MEYVIIPGKGLNHYILCPPISHFPIGKSLAFKRVQKGKMIKLYSNYLSFTFEHDVFKEISVIENKRFDLILRKYNLFDDSYIINLLQDNYTCTFKYGFIIFDEP